MNKKEDYQYASIQFRDDEKDKALFLELLNEYHGLIWEIEQNPSKLYDGFNRMNEIAHQFIRKFGVYYGGVDMSD